jgi:peptidyl-prolyl cis-trans isomerase SurA
MLKSRIVNVEIRSKLVITNERIQEYYDTHYKQSADVPEGYHILQIGISWGDDPNGKTRVEAREAAEMVRQRIAAGDDFSNLAREYSDLPSAEDGGDIGTFRKDEMAPYMLNAIKNILPGETSDVVETPSAFQILKLISANQDGVVTQAPIDTVRNQIKDTIYRQEMEKEYDKWMSDIRNKAYIKKNL